VNPQQYLDTFQFDHELVLNENINTVSAVEQDFFVSNRLRKLKLKGNVVATPFMRQALFIG
jgi:hypothetical protein